MVELKINDLVTGYHKGYHKILGINGCMVEYIRIDGKRRGVKKCHISYCKLVDPQEIRDRMIAEADELYTQLISAYE